MKLITKTIEKRAPALYATEHKKPEDVRVVAKFFNPCGRSTWFMTEYDPEERIGFGYVIGELGPECDEMGYFYLADMQEIKLKWGLGIERDIHYRRQTLAEVMP